MKNNELELLLQENERCNLLLNNNLDQTEMVLDGEIVNRNTFETIRKATEEELEWFYTIRINELKIRKIKESLPR